MTVRSAVLTETEAVVAGQAGPVRGLAHDAYVELPHDAYMWAVGEALAVAGVRVVSAWTEAQEGGRLEAVFGFDQRVVNDVSWPRGVYLAWGGHSPGWALIENGRTVFALRVERYAAPEVVAEVTGDLLAGLPAPGVVDCGSVVAWEAAEAVAAWEAGSGPRTVPGQWVRR